MAERIQSEVAGVLHTMVRHINNCQKRWHERYPRSVLISDKLRLKLSPDGNFSVTPNGRDKAAWLHQNGKPELFSEYLQPLTESKTFSRLVTRYRELIPHSLLPLTVDIEDDSHFTAERGFKVKGLLAAGVHIEVHQSSETAYAKIAEIVKIFEWIDTLDLSDPTGGPIDREYLVMQQAHITQESTPDRQKSAEFEIVTATSPNLALLKHYIKHNTSGADIEAIRDSLLGGHLPDYMDAVAMEIMTGTRELQKQLQADPDLLREPEGLDADQTSIPRP